MGKILIVANWKVNPATLVEARELFNSVEKEVRSFKNSEVVVCPPFIFIPALCDKCSAVLKLGAQDCFWEGSGAYTGEISVEMLKHFCAKYVILGHSERRKYLKETDEMIGKKIKAVIKSGLKPILCIDNISQAKGVDKKAILAFEPISAIGSGRSFPVKIAKKMRRYLASFKIVLYGGSVNSKNARDYILKAGFQGLLVGGASLNAREFISIVKSIN
jgi:triosephosphate isomerase